MQDIITLDSRIGMDATKIKLNKDEGIIYCLSTTNNIEDMRYIGYTINAAKRIKQHIKSSFYKKDPLYNTHKSRWIRKYINDNFEIKMIVLGVYTKDHLWEKEIEYIKAYKEKYKLTNLTDGGGGVLNPPQETRIKISESLKTYYFNNEDVKLRLSEINKGKKHSEESKLKMSKTRKGVQFSEDHKLKISKSHKGKIFSDKHKLNLSKARLGKKSPFKGCKRLKEICLKISQARTGKKMSEETKLKISQSNKGHKLSEESIIKRTETRRLNRLKKKHLEEQFKLSLTENNIKYIQLSLI